MAGTIQNRSSKRNLRNEPSSSTLDREKLQKICYYFINFLLYIDFIYKDRAWIGRCVNIQLREELGGLFGWRQRALASG